MNHWKRAGQYPDSVTRLCEDAGISEGEFFKMFPSLEAVESAHWVRALDGVIARVQADEDWEGFSAKQRLLLFLFAFVEDALAFRSTLLLRFSGLKGFENPRALRKFEGRFKSFAEDLMVRGEETGEIAERGPVGRLYPGGMYLHFRSVIAFYLNDESEAYERTDAFIEKTVHFAFDLVGKTAADSAADLVRFFVPRRC
ncbi:MAG: hypothetical protein WA771_06610 [Chthoniobacterales bacterium]